MIQVLLVDDQLLVRQGWTLRFSTEQDMSVVGMAANGREALEAAALLQPDVIVMDVEMPVMDGITAVERLQALRPVPVIMTSIHDDAETRQRALAAGAAAFIGKQEPVERLLAAIRRCSAV